MQPNRFEDAQLWLNAADMDVSTAERMADIPGVACFHAQQASEKSIKAVMMAVSGDTTRSHLSDALLKDAKNLGLDIPEQIASDARFLDRFYTITRYPDALGSDVATAFTAGEAADALEKARSVKRFAQSLVEQLRDS